MFNKKAISPVVATSLLLVVAVVAVVSFQGWYQTFSSNLFVDAEQDSGNLDTSGIEGIIGDTLYLKAGNNLTVESVRIDGNDCNINGTYSGTQGLDVSECLSQTNSATPEIVMVTDDKVLSKSVYLDDKTTQSLSQATTNPLADPQCYSAPVNTIGNWTGCQDMLIVNNSMLISAGTPPYEFGTGGSFQIEYNGINYTLGDSQYNVFTGQVTELIYTFYNSNFNDSINYWDVSNVIDMTGMFEGATSFDQPLNNWDVSSVTFMDGMFFDAISFDQPLNNWNVGSVTNMGGINSWEEGMFQNAISFNQSLDNWDVSNVAEMNKMFNNATSFNQNLSSWDVDQVTSCTDFNTSTPAWTLPKPNFTSC